MGSRLTYYRWYVDEVETMEELLTHAEMGELFFAVMDYVRDGTVREVSPEARYAYRDCLKKVDRSRAAYEKKVANLSANGAKGGRARAESVRRARAEASGEAEGWNGVSGQETEAREGESGAQDGSAAETWGGEARYLEQIRETARTGKCQRSGREGGICQNRRP